MTLFDSKVSKFSIDDPGTVPLDLSSYLTEIRGLPGPRLLNEVTALGDAGAKFIPGLEDVTFNLRGLFDDTASSGPDAVLGPLRTNTTAVSFEYGPEGTAAGDVKYSGTCWVTLYELRSRVGNLVEWVATLQVEGTLTRGTY